MKNINIVNKIVATNLKLNLKIVETINKIYWKEIVKELSTASESPVHIKKLGTIEASPYKTNKYIKKLIYQIRRVQNSTKYTDETKERVVNIIKERLTKALTKRNQHAKLFYEQQRFRISKTDTNSNR